MTNCGVGVVYPTSLRSGWKFSDVLCVPRVHGTIVNSANCHVVKIMEWLRICRPVVSCVTRDLRSGWEFGDMDVVCPTSSRIGWEFGDLSCRVSHVP